MTVRMHPQAQRLLDGKAASGAPPTWEQTPAQARAGYAATRDLIGPGPAVASARDLAVPGRAGPIPARVYTPLNASAGIVVYFHGGGWVIGSVDDWDACCRSLAAASGCRLLSVDYRLAPEHRFPAAADDAYDALTWAAGAAQLTSAGPLIVAGDSAGGNLAAVCAQRARDADGPDLVLQVLIYPVTDHDLERLSYRSFDGNEFFVNRRDMEWFWDHYVPSVPDRDHPYASPLRAASLSGLPPAYIVTAEHDPLRDEGFAYADRLRAARVPVQHRHYGTQIHGFFPMVNILDDAAKAIADAGSAIRAAADGAVRGSERVTQEA